MRARTGGPDCGERAHDVTKRGHAGWWRGPTAGEGGGPGGPASSHGGMARSSRHKRGQGAHAATQPAGMATAEPTTTASSEAPPASASPSSRGSERRRLRSQNTYDYRSEASEESHTRVISRLQIILASCLKRNRKSQETLFPSSRKGKSSRQSKLISPEFPDTVFKSQEVAFSNYNDCQLRSLCNRHQNGAHDKIGDWGAAQGGEGNAAMARS